MGTRLLQPPKIYEERFSPKPSSRGLQNTVQSTAGQNTVQSTAGQNTDATVYRVLFSRIPNDINKLSTVLDSAVHAIMEFRKVLQPLGLRTVDTAYKEAWLATLVGHASLVARRAFLHRYRYPDRTTGHWTDPSDQVPKEPLCAPMSLNRLHLPTSKGLVSNVEVEPLT